MSNIKIVFGTIAVIAAVYSHFNRGEFPANRLLVSLCVLIYSICVSVMSLASTIWESSAMFVGKLSPMAKQVSKGKLASNLWVHSAIGVKGSSEYKVEFRTKPHRKSGNVSAARGYENYFTEDGKLLLSKFRADLEDVLSRVDSESKKTS